MLHAVQAVLELRLSCAHCPIAVSSPLRAVLTAFDLSPFHHAVDLGGATGAFMVQLAALHPHCRCTVVDLPHVVVAGACALKGGEEGEVQGGPPVVIACMPDRVELPVYVIAVSAVPLVPTPPHSALQPSATSRGPH